MDHGDRFSREGSERNSHDLTELVCKFFFSLFPHSTHSVQCWNTCYKYTRLTVSNCPQ